MEAEKEEAIKRYNNALSLWNIILAVQVVAVVALFGHWCFPAIVNIPQVFTFWFDWFRLFLRNIFFVFLIVNALVGFIYLSFRKTAGENEPDLYDQYSAAATATVRTAPVVGGGYYDDGYSNDKAIVPEVEMVKESKCGCCDGVEIEVKSKSYRRTRSEKKARSSSSSSMVEYRRTESERVTRGTASWRSRTMDGLSSEEFRMTVETFITQKKKKMLLQQNGVVLEELSGDNGTSRSRRLVGGSVTTGSGPHLPISN